MNHHYLLRFNNGRSIVFYVRECALVYQQAFGGMLTEIHGFVYD